MPNTNKKQSTKEPVESHEGIKSTREDRNTTPVPTRVGQNTVDIDVPALRHLVGKLKSELMPGQKT